MSFHPPFIFSDKTDCLQLQWSEAGVIGGSRAGAPQFHGVGAPSPFSLSITKHCLTSYSDKNFTRCALSVLHQQPQVNTALRKGLPTSLSLALHGTRPSGGATHEPWPVRHCGSPSLLRLRLDLIYRSVSWINE